MTSACIAGCGREARPEDGYCTICMLREARLSSVCVEGRDWHLPVLREAPLHIPAQTRLHVTGRCLQLTAAGRNQRDDILDAIQKLSECQDYSLYRLSHGLGEVASASILSALCESVLPDHARLIGQLVRGTPRLGDTPRLMRKSIERGSPFPLDSPQHLALMIYAERQVRSLDLLTTSFSYVPYWRPLTAVEQEEDGKCCGVLTRGLDLSYVWARHATTTMHVARYFSDGTLTGRQLAEAYRLAVALYIAVRELDQ